MGISIHDMDENGCPDAGRENWRKYRVEELLANAVAEYRKGRSSVIGGWIWPHEVIDSAYFSLDLNLHFIFLKNTEAEYRKRLKRRVGTRMTKAEFDAWIKNFPIQRKRLENQVRFTARHTVVNAWELSRAEVVKRALANIRQLAS